MIRLLFHAVLGLGFFGSAFALNENWRPPTGIPTPPFGITTTHWMYSSSTYTWDYGSGPQPYRANQFGPYSHYVDNTHPAATDVNNPYGSESVPRRTWPYPLPAGSAVQVHGGPYNYSNAQSSTLAFGGAGTAERPIFLYGTTDNRQLMPQVARSALYAWGNYAVIERLRFSNDCVVSTRPLLKGAPVLNVAIRYCYFRGTGTTGNPTCINSGGSSGNSAENYTQTLVILGNEMHDYGNWQAPTENDACAFILSQNCIDAWVLDNVAYHFGGDSIRIGADQGDLPSGRNYYIGRNYFHDNRENAVDVKQAVNAVISENVMHGFPGSSSDPGSAVVIHYNPKNIWFLNNTVSNARRGIMSTGVSNDHLYLIGNTLHSIEEHALYPDRGGGHVHVYNNTIHDCGTGIVSTGVIQSLDIHGNLLFNIAGHYLQVAQSAVRAASSVSHELYYEAGGAVSISWGSTYTSVAAWIAGTTAGDNSLEQPPAFVDAPNRDYRLLPGSPAIGAGFDLTALDATFQSLFGVTLLRDVRGVTRPSDGSFDIGANEFTSPAQSFAAWAQSWSLPAGQDGPDHDPDHDSASNVLEYALGLDPTQASSASLPALQPEGGLLVYRFNRPKSAGPLSWRTRISTDLTNWSDGPVPNLESSTATHETFTVALAAGELRRFLKLEVSIP